jgi:hypothetical protein
MKYPSARYGHADVLQIATSATARLLSEDDLASTRIQLDVVQLTAAYLPTETRLQICGDVIEELASFSPESITNGEASPAANNKAPAKLEVLLELALIHHKPMCSIDSATHRESLLLILSRLMTNVHHPLPAPTLEFTFDVAAIFADNLPTEAKHSIRASLGDLASHPRIRFLFGFTDRVNGWLYTTNELTDSVEFTLHTGDDQSGKQPYMTRAWDMLADATPNVGVNDTAISLRNFGGRRV